MKCSRRLLFLIGTICLFAQSSLAQVASQPPSSVAAGTGSISGRVLVDGKPMPRVHLSAQRAPFASTATSSSARADSDDDGRYRFSGLPPGSYSISPLSSVYIWGDGRPGEGAKTITIGDSEQATEVDISLKRGGVVTGKVTDADGSPVVGRFVQIDRADGARGSIPVGIMSLVDFSTDDRGVYRYYGVPPGKYRVSCGDGEGSFRTSSQGKTYPRTFHPGVAEQGLATIVEVAAESETTGVDIRLGPATKTYSIAGRTVDADTNQPVTGLSITSDMPAADGRPPQYGGRTTVTPSGEFVLSSVRSGRWRISAESGYPFQGGDSGGYSDPIFVEVQEENVTGVEIRVRRGGSIAGVAVIEGALNIPNPPRLLDQQVMVSVQPGGGASSMAAPFRPLRLAPDGSFRADGLRPGRASFVQATRPGDAGSLRLIRTERDGQAVPNGIELGPGENLTGVRLVFVYANSNIVGQVMITGGELPPGVTLIVMARPIGGGTGGSGRADARGTFVIERLAAGQYELDVRPMLPQPNNQMGVLGTAVKQTVSLATGETEKVTLTFAMKERQ